MKGENIRIASSIPSLENKIQSRIEANADTIYWYIKFNIPLDASSVSHKTMNVTDTDGYIMRSDISYEEENNAICISPLDSYEQNRFYLLNISKNVRSEKGQRLRSEIHILFKLLGNQIADYKILRKNVKVPKPQKRPKNYDLIQTKSRVYSFDTSVTEGLPQDRLASTGFKVNLWTGLAGLALTLAGLYMGVFPLTAAALILCAAGVAHIFYQFTRRELRAILVYNKGVRHFNRERYKAAETSFSRALALNPDFELAEYALNKVSFYTE